MIDDHDNAQELDAFERNALRHIKAFLDPERAKSQRTHRVGQPPRGTRVRLAVRRKRLDVDSEFIHDSDSISFLEARFDAEKAARAAGYPVIGYVIEYEARR
ncbi:hypothetical protein [Halomonas sp. NO4]|uniref:hypothetical protein n=1 Tax=Halomonas sp. NO4 TaxID=2484813 RepID=UPI0013D159FE|nr:hypothetical protein [Halomonas sp. NO4]